MSSVAPPTTPPPAGWATWTDALLTELLAQLARHDAFPMGPGIPQIGRRVLDETLLAEVLKPLRREG